MTQLSCNSCKRKYSTDQPVWRCTCGGLLDLDHTPRFPLELIASRPPTMWRYREALPLGRDENIVSMGEGFTPLLDIVLDGRHLLVKQEQLSPTGSFKDRGASVLISKVKELGVSSVVEDSSGNAGSALAAYAARAGIGCGIYVPRDTRPSKIAQIRLYGATLELVEGTREDTARAVLTAAETTYYASHSWNPFFFHGTKTLAFEVCEQLGWSAPDVVIAPVGNGSIILGLSIGFRELIDAGILQHGPRIVGVQAAACAPLARILQEGLTHFLPRIEKGRTIAEGIAIATPIRWAQIVDAVRSSGGDILAVSEEEILKAFHKVASMGFSIEPTSAVAVAGFLRYAKGISAREVVISMFTGHGLKASDLTSK